MRTLAITQNITLDGAVEMLGDWFDDQARGAEEVIAENRRQQERADALLVGRQTFEDFRGYWRDLQDDDTGVSDYLNGVPKYVVSSTLRAEDADWPGTTVLTGDLVDEVRALKAAPGRDIVCTGSITLTHALVEAGLVDEYRLFVYPVVQGGGRRLFPDGWTASGLTCVEATAFPNGVAYLRHVARA